MMHGQRNIKLNDNYFPVQY